MCLEIADAPILLNFQEDRTLTVGLTLTFNCRGIDRSRETRSENLAECQGLLCSVFARRADCFLRDLVE